MISRHRHRHFSSPVFELRARLPSSRLPQQGILSGALLLSFVSRPSPSFPVGRVPCSFSFPDPFLDDSLLLLVRLPSFPAPSNTNTELLNPGHSFLSDTCLTLIRTCHNPTCFFSLLHLWSSYTSHEHDSVPTYPHGRRIQIVLS
jgi:hypothetical protein